MIHPDDIIATVEDIVDTLRSTSCSAAKYRCSHRQHNLWFTEIAAMEVNYRCCGELVTCVIFNTGTKYDA